MKRFFLLLTLGAACLYIAYRLLIYSIAMRPMGLGVIMSLAISGATGLLVFCEALYAAHSVVLRWLADRQWQKKLNRATARLPLLPRSLRMLFPKKFLSRC